MNRRAFLQVATFAATIAFQPGARAAHAGFDQRAFDAAQADGKPILVHVTAPWCPTCKAQAPILSRLESEMRFKDMVTFNIDFDTQKDLLRKFGVRTQSTIIVFKGRQEAGRSTGVTDPAAIEQLLAKAI
jgi:thiol-disulfide isomerase/thioredoxin